jgi:hypothetical protein
MNASQCYVIYCLSSLVDFVRLIFNETMFRKPTVLPSSGIEVSNVVDP